MEKEIEELREEARNLRMAVRRLAMICEHLSPVDYKDLVEEIDTTLAHD